MNGTDAAAGKRQILSAIRRAALRPVDLPSLDGPWLQYDDRPKQFASVLEAVGGRAVFVPDLQQINPALEQLAAYRQATRICSLVEGVGRSDVDLDAIQDPHQLEDVDFAILPAEFGVAENAALWVTDAGVKHRVLYFLVQHLALVVSAGNLVDNLHQAYQRLDLQQARFGLFISGPSKTADIEQSLVIGAHGARSLTVFLVAPSPTR